MNWKQKQHYKLDTDITAMRVSYGTIRRLQKVGSMGDSLEDVVIKLLDFWDENKYGVIKMTDASWGYTAEEGFKAVLTGENIDKINKREGAMSPDEMRKYLLEAPNKKNVSYSDESRRFAKSILEKIELNDTYKQDFISNSYKFASEVEEKGDYDLTGFMFGWAVNAVRYVINEVILENPAIIEIGK